MAVVEQSVVRSLPNNHPNIVKFHDAGISKADNEIRYFILSEYCPSNVLKKMSGAAVSLSPMPAVEIIYVCGFKPENLGCMWSPEVECVSLMIVHDRDFRASPQPFYSRDVLNDRGCLSLRRSLRRYAHEHEFAHGKYLFLYRKTKYLVS